MRVLQAGGFVPKRDWDECVIAGRTVSQNDCPVGSILWGFYEWMDDHPGYRVFGPGPYIGDRDREACMVATAVTLLKAPPGSILAEYLNSLSLLE